MSCDLELALALVAFGNAFVSTPPAGAGELLAPPLEPLLLAKMWLSWVGAMLAIRRLADCYDASGRQEDAASLRRRLQQLEQEVDRMKRQVGSR
jgi:hypothetical protein